MKNKITFGLYSVQRGEDFNRAIINEIEKIIILKNKFEDAASASSSEFPEVVLSIFLIPEWKEGQNFDSDIYIKAKKYFFELISKELEKHQEFSIKIEDFYCDSNLDEKEKAYLENLQARGSNADMIKTHAIIREENSKLLHLQLDSNIKIFSVNDFYKQTFASDIDKDALNASFYDKYLYYVSAHNKIVYTTPYGEITKKLKEIHLHYCSEHAQDEPPEKTEKNSIYSKDFAVAISEIELSTKSSCHDKTYYSADMTKIKEYRITSNIITAVNMSWSDEAESKEEEHLKALRNLPEVQVGDAKCGFACFAMIIKKYTRPLRHHVLATHRIDENEASQQLLALSNLKIDKLVVDTFVKYIAEDNFKMVQSLIDTIPKNPKGEEFIRNFFECDTREEILQKLRNGSSTSVILVENLEKMNINKESLKKEHGDQVERVEQNQKDKALAESIPLRVTGTLAKKGTFKGTPPPQPEARQNTSDGSADICAGIANGF